jgi:hypothetical protein
MLSLKSKKMKICTFTIRTIVNLMSGQEEVIQVLSLSVYNNINSILHFVYLCVYRTCQRPFIE